MHLRTHPPRAKDYIHDFKWQTGLEISCKLAPSELMKYHSAVGVAKCGGAVTECVFAADVRSLQPQKSPGCLQLLAAIGLVETKDDFVDVGTDVVVTVGAGLAVFSKDVVVVVLSRHLLFRCISI